MTPTSQNGFLLSAALHAAAVALVLLLGYVGSQSEKEIPKILELVAGEGDNYMAREAPALGSEGGVTFNVPAAPAPKPVPLPPVTVEPSPVVPAPPAPKVVTPAPKAVTPPPKVADDTIPDFKKKIRRDIIVADSKAKQQIARERAAEAKRAAEEQRRMTKEEFDRANKAKTVASAKSSTPNYKKLDPEGIAKGVVGGSTANKVGGAGGKALTSDNADVLAGYYKLFKDRLRLEFESPPGLSDSLKVTIEVRSSADGSLSGARVTQGSGSADFDRAVLQAIQRVKMPARPDRKPATIEFVFNMRDRGDG